MRVALGAILAFVIGLVVTYVAAVAIGLGYMHAYNVHDRDGGMSMAIMFGIGPLAGIIGGVIAAIVAGVWLSRRESAGVTAGHAVKPWPPALLLAVAVVAGVLVYYIVWGVIGIAGPRSYASYGAALAVSLTPPALALATAGFIGWRASR